MSPTITVDAVRYAERIRRMIWTDVVEGRIPPAAVAGFSALKAHVNADAYLRRADLPPGELLDLGARAAAAVELVDAWMRSGALRLPYGAFTPQDVTLLSDFLRAAERSQRDVEILADIAGEWLAGIRDTTSAGEFGRDHQRALLALAHDALAR